MHASIMLSGYLLRLLPPFATSTTTHSTFSAQLSSVNAYLLTSPLHSIRLYLVTFPLISEKHISSAFYSLSFSSASLVYNIVCRSIFFFFFFVSVFTLMKGNVHSSLLPALLAKHSFQTQLNYGSNRDISKSYVTNEIKC